MIQEIVNFIDYLEEKSPDIFSENRSLNNGLYVFLEKENGQLVIKDENVLKVDDKTEKTELYNQFLERFINTEMLSINKSFNSSPKTFIAIGTPYGITLNGKAYKEKAKEKLKDAAKAYFKAAESYMPKNKIDCYNWKEELKKFVQAEMFEFLESDSENAKVKKDYMFCFFHKEPILEDFLAVQNAYLSEKLFNKDKFNVKTNLGETHGISDNLSGFNDSKTFLKHKTATIELNYRVSSEDANKLYKFFKLQQKNKVLPNPFPLFVDELELTEEAVKFYKKNNKYGHKEIIEELINKKKGDLQNYYLIYFNSREKGSGIIDLDFISVFKYIVNNIKLDEPFPLGGKFKSLPITNIFEFQKNILNKIFNNQLIVERKDGGTWLKYFDDMKPNDFATDVTVDLFYMYRKSIYDYVYKSRRQAITDRMFQDMMIKSIIDDIKRDELKNGNNTNEYRIKEKLNIWFSLYNYFTKNNNTDMVNKTTMLMDRIKTIAKPENSNEHITNSDEYAFAAGQLIRTILNKSEAGERSHALLEPFLQKAQSDKLNLAIARAFETYKHAFKFYKGDNNRYEFDKIMSEVLGFSTEQNLKELLPLILAGYFAETIFKREKETEEKI